MKPRMTKVLWYIAGSLLIVFLCAWYKGLFRCSTAAQVNRVLSDAFFIIGGIATGVGVVSFCVKEGTFDSLKRLYTGKEAEPEKKRSWLGLLFVCGVVMCAIGALFAFL